MSIIKSATHTLCDTKTMKRSTLAAPAFLATLLLAALTADLAAQAPANDNFANAIELPGTSNGTPTGNNRNATAELNEPAFLDGYTGKSVWWK